MALRGESDVRGRSSTRPVPRLQDPHLVQWHAFELSEEGLPGPLRDAPVRGPIRLLPHHQKGAQAAQRQPGDQMPHQPLKIQIPL